MSPHAAARRHGTCTGSLWKSHSRVRGDSDDDAAASFDGIVAEANEQHQAHDFCVLVGNTLWSYSDVWAYAKGDPPTSEIRIVGASAWNPPSVPKNSTAPGELVMPRPASPMSNTTYTSTSTSLDFLIVTYSGTHVHCSAPTPSDKDKWLAALHNGLEGNIRENRVEALMALSHREPPATLPRDVPIGEGGREAGESLRRMKSHVASDMAVQTAIFGALSAFGAEVSLRPFVPPLPRVEANSGSSKHSPRDSSTPICTDTPTCIPATSRGDHWCTPLSDTHCTACGRYPPEHEMRIDAAPLPEYGMEVRVDLCHDCCIAQGVLQHVRYLGWLYEAEAWDRAVVRAAWQEVKKVARRPMGVWPEENRVRYSGALLEVVGTKRFLEYRQKSGTLDSLCERFEEKGVSCAPDFLEGVEECALAAQSSGFFSEKVGLRENINLKKEAFKVAGDMTAALKLLYEYALPPERANSSCPRNNADMLAAILEFFLDLCDEGQMDSVALFWPQLCHIHMQMLPPRDTEAMVRVELVEDFLLTVSTRYSVHLALDLVWSLTADLEESLGLSNCSSLSRRRRFAVLRFVSELESLMFGFDGGWGGGGVSLHGMLVPSRHQAALLKDAMSLLQLRRRFGSHHLTRSVRLDNLRVEAQAAIGDGASVTTKEFGARARIAKNAAYFSSHMAFSRRLGDVAEKLRFMAPEQRPNALQEELRDINVLGNVLGGDPLNRLCLDGQFQRAVRLPIKEGYVFRSKERTPVLLLVELVKDPPNVISGISESLGTQSLPDIARIDIAEGKNDDFVSREGTQTPPDRTQCSDDSSQEASVSSSRENIDNQKDLLLCPSTPTLLHGAHGNAPHASSGRSSPRVLSLTRGASEATSVTEEGKEMMADMIATLIVNKKNQIPVLPLNDSETRQQPHSPSQADNRGDSCRSDTEDITSSQSFPRLKVSDHSLPTPSSIVTVSPGSDMENGRKFSALRTIFPQTSQSQASADLSKSTGIHLTADMQFRRDVLFAIMERGRRGSNVIAQGAATAACRAMQAMDRKRAIALMNEPTPGADKSGNVRPKELLSGSSLGFNREISSQISISALIDEDEVMEALRLLIIQNKVAQGNLVLENAMEASTKLKTGLNTLDRTPKGVDAGKVDQRLAGCGNLSSSILSALRLWKGGIISNGELLELVQKDLQFLKQSAVFGLDENNLIEDSAFWGRFSFGERWAEKKARLAASSPHGSFPGWDLLGCIVKSNDDLRQEVFVMQLIRICEEAFQTAGLDLWVHSYHIVATGLSTGIIECVRNAMSFDALKKRPGYGTDGLMGHFRRMTEIAADPTKALDEAKQNFVSSLAAYSLMSYIFMFKDRHNGNLLLDTAGHVIHIDFGFVFGIAPGGSFSLEQSTPFKLTDEMLEVMGGLGSPLFSEFVTLFCCGFLALQAHADTFLTVVEVTCRGSSFPCFNGKDHEEVLSKLRERFCPDLDKSQTVAYALDLIKFATTSYGTKQYDYFQYLSQGIAT